MYDSNLLKVEEKERLEIVEEPKFKKHKTEKDREMTIRLRMTIPRQHDRRDVGGLINPPPAALKNLNCFNFSLSLPCHGTRMGGGGAETRWQIGSKFYRARYFLPGQGTSPSIIRTRESADVLNFAPQLCESRPGLEQLPNMS